MKTKMKIHTHKYKNIKKSRLIHNFHDFKKIAKKYTIYKIKRSDTSHIENVCDIICNKIIKIQSHVRGYLCRKKYAYLLSSHKFPKDMYLNNMSILGNSIEEIEDDYFINITSTVANKYYYFDIRELHEIIKKKKEKQNNHIYFNNNQNVILVNYRNDHDNNDDNETEPDTDTESDTDTQATHYTSFHIFNTLNTMNTDTYDYRYHNVVIQNPYNNIPFDHKTLAYIEYRLHLLVKKGKSLLIDNIIPEDSLLTIKIMTIITILNDNSLYPDIQLFNTFDIHDFINIINIIIEYSSIRYHINRSKAFEIYNIYHDDDLPDENYENDIKNNVLDILLELLQVSDLFIGTRCLIIYYAIQFNSDYPYEYQNSIVNYSHISHYIPL